MGRRSRKKKGKSRAAEAARRFHENSLRYDLDASLEYEKHKENQKKHIEDYARQERDLLSRTVFVTQVRDLKQPVNVDLLRRFFQTSYGPVEECAKHRYSGKKRKSSNNFPPARVRFVRESDARRIFGGKSLLQAKVDRDAVKIRNSTIGHRGFISVRPVEPYHGMLEEFKSRSTISVSFSHFCMGHWLPWSEDSYHSLGADSAASHGNDENQFLEVERINTDSTMSLNLTSRTASIVYSAVSSDRARKNPFAAFLGSLVDSEFHSLSYVLEFRFKDLQGCMDLCVEGSDSYALVFRLKYPPKAYSIHYDQDIDIEVKERHVELPGLDRDLLGTALSYKMFLSRQQVELVLEYSKVERLRSFGILRGDLYSIQDTQAMSSLGTYAADVAFEPQIRGVTDEKSRMLLRSLLDSGKVPLYHMIRDEVHQKNVFSLVSSAAARDSQHALTEMISMSRETRFPAKLLHTLISAQKEERESKQETQNDTDMAIPSHCVEMARVTITPTRNILSGFEVEMSNRVVRHFVSSEGFPILHFLRVSVAEENGENLFHDDLSVSVCDRIREVFTNGLNLNDKKYHFLAYSSSQLKERSFWMVHCIDSWNISRMRKWMRDFHACKTPSKYAARMGQCFSTTVQTLEGSKRNSYRLTGLFSNPSGLRVNDKLTDITTFSQNGKEYCHTDGTGLVRKDLLASLLKQVPFAPADTSEVSIVQIRFGGAKGTLTGWDFDDIAGIGRLGGARKSDVLLRPSMVKFDADYRHLEVISIGKRIPYYLNRHVLLLLGVHDIKDEIFLRMQHAMLERLNKMLECGSTAADMLPRMSGPDSSLTSTLVNMISCGMSPARDPYLFSCAHAIRSHHLMQLRKKSRILVENGAVLIGGVDETGRLPEGCVFIQLCSSFAPPRTTQPSQKKTFEVLEGPVMVTKHPVMHPGDVRMLLAVNIPELRHHKNVILFSQHGVRPEPDKMSGSDLDGDQFAVTWDERLFLNAWNMCRKLSHNCWISSSGSRLSIGRQGMRASASLLEEANSTPLDFDTQGNMQQMERIGDKELCNHFINFAKSDNLGRISTMWLDYAAKNGANCKQCLELAKLASIAVDFPKSGVPATIPQEIVIPRNTPRPHWRERSNIPSYHCTSVIGRLYDEVTMQIKRDKDQKKDRPIAMAGRSFDRNNQVTCFLDKKDDTDLDQHLRLVYSQTIPELLGFWDGEGQETMLSFASEQRLLYEDRIISIMKRFGLRSEGETMTGCIRKCHKLHKRRQHELCQEIRLKARELTKEYRQNFFSIVLEMICPDDPIFSQDLGIDEREKLEEERLEQVAVAIGEPVALTEIGPFFPNQVLALKRCARRLAAAYYLVTYHPDMRWRQSSGYVLFSFPWIVSDVIAQAFQEHQ